MKQANSFEDFAKMLSSDMALGMVEAHKGLLKAARLVKKTCEKEIGNPAMYRNDYPPFDRWPELADATEEFKVSHGFPGNAPLERTGEMRESFRAELDSIKFESVVGSIDPKMRLHEFGTPRMPMRPVLGPAIVRNLDKIAALTGGAAISGFFDGKNPIHESLGYNQNASDET